MHMLVTKSVVIAFRRKVVLCLDNDDDESQLFVPLNTIVIILLNRLSIS